MADTPHIVVLGGGFGGMFAAREIQRTLAGRATVEIINDENYFVFQPLLPEVAAGSIAAVHAVTPLRFLLRDCTVRKASIAGVDFDRKIVTVFQGVQRRPTEIGYDHLVLALGQSVDLSKMPGMPEHALTMKTLDDASRLRAHVIEKLEHADITRLPEVKREVLTFTVVGGGFSGIETVGEVTELIDRVLKYYPNVARSEVRVIVVEFLDRILGELPESLGRYAHEVLEKRGIELRLGVGVDHATGTRLFTTDGAAIETRTIVATIGNGPGRLVRELDLPVEQGKIVVDRSLRVAGHDGVWALGDCALIPMTDRPEGRGDYAPPTAQFAIREAKHVAAALDATLAGRAPTPFVYTSKGSLASLGGRRGVADVMGMRLTGFPAWLLWRLYYVGTLPGLSTKIGVLFNWLLDAIAPRTLVQLRPDALPGSRYVLYSAGDRIYETGNRADGLYTVVEGAVEVVKTDPATGQELVRRLGPGDHFGERVVMGEDRRGATARAVTDSRILILGRDEVIRIADGFAVFRDYFEDHIGQRLETEYVARDAENSSVDGRGAAAE